nr:hypothetical protein [Angustibacter aerolatus]
MTTAATGRPRRPSSGGLGPPPPSRVAPHRPAGRAVRAAEPGAVRGVPVLPAGHGVRGEHPAPGVAGSAVRRGPVELRRACCATACSGARC